MITRKLLSAKSSKYGTKNSDVLKFEQLYNKLTKKWKSGTTSMSEKTSMLYMLYKISNIEEDSNNSSNIFSTILSSTNYTDENTEQPMEVDDYVNNRQKENRAGQLQLLKHFRYRSKEISEEILWKDLLYIFQGIDGQFISFSLLEDAFVLEPSVNVSSSTRKLVTEMWELGWLYRKVNGFMTRNIDSTYWDQVTQSLWFTFQAELTEFYRLIAMLENQHQNYDESDPANWLNLRKLYLWIQEPLERMKWLAIIVDSIEGLKGGALISSINSYVLHGAPGTKILLSKLLKEVSAPILTMIKTWMIEGELNDPFQEFFVSMNPDVPDDLIWTNKYELKHDMIPSFLTNELARKILLTGKAVNFIKKWWNEEEWILDASSQIPYNSEDWLADETSYDVLKKWVYHAYRVTNKELIRFLFEKYQFYNHWRALRKYLLLGQGDFIQNLMDLLVNELLKPAGQLYKYSLLGILETAVRASNAYLSDSEFLDRLDVRLLEASPGDNGWDIFSLDYKVDPPINTILTPETIQGYLKIFNLLWKLKRVEHALNATWIQQISEKNKLYSIVEIRSDLHKCSLLQSEMLHFINNLHSYLQVEVIESEWKKFSEELNDAEDLYQIMTIQKNFISSVHSRAMLTSAHIDLYQLMIKIFEQIHKFKYTQDLLYKSALEEYDRRHLYQEEPLMPISNEARKQLNMLRMQYREYFDRFNDLLSQLEIDQKSLSFRLDFNEFYKESRERGEDRPMGGEFEMLDVDGIEDDEEEEEEDEEEEIDTRGRFNNMGM
jgi:gamma-tubulin complex component 3